MFTLRTVFLRWFRLWFYRSYRPYCLLTFVCFFALPILALNGLQVTAQSSPAPDYLLFTDALAPGWVNWSWGTEVDFQQSQNVQTGGRAMAVTYQSAWAGLFLHIDEPVIATEYGALQFWVHGGPTAGQMLKVVLLDGAGNGLTDLYLTAQSSWQKVTFSFDQLGLPAAISGIMIQEVNGAPQPTLYLDEVRLLGRIVDTTPIGTVSLSVDPANTLHLISPYIYGMNFAPADLAQEIALPVNRWGGNATTRYNWQFDVSNRASDWFFQNIPNEEGGNSADAFVQANLARGTAPMITIPLIGWTPKGREITCGFPVSLYGAQQSVDPWRPDCGNGVRTDGTLITNNDPRLTSVPFTPADAQAWIAHLQAQFGSAREQGVRFYSLDNEPMLWNHTHRDVHPNPTGYDELRDLTYLYGSAIKSADPAAKTFGPVLWGWTAYFYSGIDAASGNWTNPPDYSAHGNTPFVAWYLQQMAAYEAQHGVRLLDYLDLHYYPQQANVALQSAGNLYTQQLRLRSTRALWDVNYTDESWINQPVKLLPRMKEWVNDNYPDTKLALTEYNFGAVEHINGALAQADVLGIFGREDLDLATMWDPPASNQPAAFAFRLYRNYDGAGGQFGNLAVQASSSNQDQVAVYSARRLSDGKTTVMLVNKAMATVTAEIVWGNLLSANSAEVYRYSSADLTRIVRQPDLAIASRATTFDLSADSITLLVLNTQPSPTAVHYRHLPLILSSGTNALIPLFGLLSPATLWVWYKNNAKGVR